MTIEDLYHGISEIHPKYLEEADAYKARKPARWKKWSAAACICVCFGSAVPVLSAADNKIAYELLYMISPSAAQKLKPVRISCEDNGIKMEVAAANIEGHKETALMRPQTYLTVTAFIRRMTKGEAAFSLDMMRKLQRPHLCWRLSR